MRIRAEWVLCVAFGACQGSGAPPVPEQVIEREADQVLAAYQEPWAVVCDDLVVEITANFYETVSHPAVDASLHSRTQDDGEKVRTTRWVNRRGGLQGAFRIAIGATTFAAVRSLELRVLKGTHAFTLDASATGNVTVRRGDGAPRDAALFRIRDGKTDLR